MLANRLDSATRYLDNTNVDEVALRQDIQNTLLSIPGHAKYFADEIRKKQEAVKDLPPNTGERVNYDSMRRWNFETLQHLPSPETVKELGSFFHDDKDLAVAPPSRPGDYGCAGGSPPSSILAVEAMSRLGIRIAPNYDIYALDPLANISPWQSWWEEIKSGKKAFSFKGQKVEYRFKPDGTWDTIALINPPEDAPQTQKAPDPRGKNQTLTSTVKAETGRTASLWPWIVGGVITALVTAFGFFLRRHVVGK
jgi:hypothetical protein